MSENAFVNKYPGSIISRVFDVCTSLFATLLLSPIILIVSLLILIDGTKGSVLLLSPERLKKGGKKFMMYKFRYMVPDAHKRMKKGEYGLKLKEKWESNGGKLNYNEDPRITKIGKFLRRTDIDEIPQLINVIRGDMSIVGPRPYFEDEVIKYRKQFPKLSKCFEDILSVRPGITGLWQVSGRNSLPLEERIKLDSECARKKSLFFDIWILIRTPYVVITRKGAM